MLEHPTKYPILDVSTWAVVAQETIGAEEKYWLAEPASGTRWLFKPNNSHDGPSGRWYQCEDISEKVSGEIAMLFNIPCAHIELAKRNGERGCLSRDLKPRNWELQSGQVLLSGIVPGYVPGSDISNKTRVGHSLEKISIALGPYDQPPNSLLPPHFNAFDTFVGYLVFDALIANRDRHDENWAVMRPIGSGTRGKLAGSFDHARAFGSSLRDDAALGRVLERGVERWAARGTAWRFEHTRPPGPCTLVELARSALALVTSEVRSYWLERAAAIDHGSVALITGCVPGMSEVASTFIQQVFATNQRRVLNDC